MLFSFLTLAERRIYTPYTRGFRFLSYVQGKCGVDLRGNNVRDRIDQLPDALRRYKGNGKAKADRAAA